MRQPREYLTPQEAAAHLRINPLTLQNWRSAGRGPRFAKAGGRVRYLREDLDRWLDANAREPEAPRPRRKRAA